MEFINIIYVYLLWLMEGSYLSVRPYVDIGMCVEAVKQNIIKYQACIPIGICKKKEIYNNIK